MAWFKGTVTSNKEMLDKIEAIGSGEHIDTVTVYIGGSGYAAGDTLTLTTGTYDHAPELEVTGVTSGDTVATAAVSAGGTGYAVGDLVYVSGGTYSQYAIIEVTSESSGVVTGVQVNVPGVYSVQPSNPAATTVITGSGNDDLTLTLTWNSSVTGIIADIFISDAGAATATPTSPVSTNTSGSGTGAQFTLTWDTTNWVTDMNYLAKVASSASISAGGSGYSVGDILAVSGGTYATNATFTVSSVSSGAVTAVTVADEGLYSTTPSNPVSTSSSQGGSGCTLTITWVNEGTTNYDIKYMIMHNSNTDVYIGLKAFSNTTYSSHVIQLHGLTGFNTINTLYGEQPGFDSSACYVSLHDSVTINYWLSIDDRRIIGVFEVDGSGKYFNMYIGLADPFMTEVEYPYPLVILGSITEQRQYSESSYYGGLPNPGTLSSSNSGPGRICLPDGTFDNFRNWYGDSDVVQFTSGIVLTPIGYAYETPGPAANRWYSVNPDYGWYGIVRVYPSVQTGQDKLMRVDDDYILIPCDITDTDNSRILGRLSDVYWFDNYDANLVTLDRIWINNEPYRVFQNGALTSKNNMFVIKES